jgi:hypothetical protein
MIFDNVNVLGYQHENKFFGEKSISYASLKTFSIRGYILDLTNINGVNNILQNFTDITKEAKTFQNIIINGENFGVGKVKSLNVDSGNWVRTTEYQAEIEVLSEAPLQNILSSEFFDLDLIDKKLSLLKSLNESFTINFDTQDKILTGDHSIDIEYDADNINIDIIKLAQLLATELLKTIPTFLSEANYTTRPFYRVFNSENYNIITGKAGFKKTFSYNNSNNINEPYSIKREQSINLNEDGVAEVTESCEIKAESNIPSLYYNCLIGLENELSGINARVLNFFNQYKSKFGILRNLNSHFVSKNIQINKFNGIINYDITYDNDPKKENPLYSWERTQTLDRSEDGIWTVAEEGSIVGIGKNGDLNKYTNAENGWTNTIQGGILSRVSLFYNNYANNKNGSGLKHSSKKIGKSRYEGTVIYNFVYSDDPKILTTGDVKRVEVEYTDTGLQPIIKNFIVPNNTYAVAQNRTLLQQGTFTISIKLSIGCINTTFNGLSYFNIARSYGGFSKRSGFSPTDPFDVYLESVNFSSDEIEKTVTYEEVYKYS